MKSRFAVHLSFVLFIFLGRQSGALFAQSYQSTTFTEKDGLLSNYVYGVSQSDDGKLLVVTRQGVCTYDGFEWASIDDGRQPVKLNTRIRQTSDGSVWLAGFREKEPVISRFSMGQWHEIPVPAEIGTKHWDQILGFDVKLLPEKAYQIILSCGFSVFTYDSEKSGWEQLNCSSMPSNACIKDVRFLKEDIFILTDKGLWLHTGESCVKLHTPFRNDYFIRMETDPEKDKCYFLGMGWLGECQNGVFTTIDSTFRIIFDDRVISASLWLSPSGRLFFGLNSNIYFLGQHNHEIRKIVTLGQMESFSHNAIFEDREGNVWVSSNRGLAMIRNLGWRFYDHNFGVPADEISGVYEWKPFKYLIGGNYFLCSLDSNGTTVLFEADRNKDPIFRFSQFTKHGDDVYFITYQKGVGCVHPDGQLEWVTGLPPTTKGINAFYFRQDSLFITSADHNWYWNRGFELINDKLEYVRNARFFKGQTWFLTNNGLAVYNGSKKINHYMAEREIRNSITDILDVGSTVVVGTHGGLCELRGDSIVPSHIYGTSITRPVYNLLQTTDSSIWVGTDDGVFVIHRDNPMKHYNTDNGLVGNEVNRYTMTETHDGLILVGTDQGMGVFDGSEESCEKRLPIPAIFSISTSMERHETTDANIITAADEDDLEIEFGAISLGFGHRFNYRYRLTGHDENWKENEYGKRAQVRYTNLSGGNFRFELQVQTDEGWSTEVHSGMITIPERFYRTWWFRTALLVFIFGVIVLIGLIFYQRKMITQKKLVERQHETITRSIRYAQRIQAALLPSEQIADQLLPPHFIYYKPKDIVAGDFFWLERQGDELLLALADCTGHGVPGAMVSVIGVNALNRAVKDYLLIEPSAILERVRHVVQESFSKSDLEMDDGMDIAVFRLNLESLDFVFAGARLHIYRVTKVENAPEAILSNDQYALIEYKTDLQSIGKLPNYKPFTQQHIHLQPGDSIYLSTDGYSDQFGGEDGKKMMIRRFREILLNLHDLEIKDQMKEIEKQFENWRGDHPQLDDVCVIGIRV